MTVCVTDSLYSLTLSVSLSVLSYFCVYYICVGVSGGGGIACGMCVCVCVCVCVCTVIMLINVSGVGSNGSNPLQLHCV